MIKKQNKQKNTENRKFLQSIDQDFKESQNGQK